MKNALILLAGGMGIRAKLKVPKQFITVGNTNFLDFYLSNLNKNIFDIIIISSKDNFIKKFLIPLKNKYKYLNIIFSNSGKNRQETVKNSLIKLKKYKPKNVLIHDSARPLATSTLINRIIKSLDKNLAVIPYVIKNDLLKYQANYKLENNKLFHIQTPQGFDFSSILMAHMQTKINNAKDDSSLISNQGINLKMIKGESTNIKITYKEDFIFFKKFIPQEFKSGIGFDIHKINFNSKKKLTLCGVKIQHPPLIGHSDADVGYHAICDSILGSLSMKDIGYYFSDKNPKWKNANSNIFIKFCQKELHMQGYKIINLDINFICETPNINNISNLMKKNLSKLLKIPTKIISIKATTSEKIGFIGRGEGIAAESIIQISNV